MSAEVVPFGGTTTLPLSPERVLEAAKAAGYEDVFVIGRLPSGAIAIAATEADSGFNVWMLRKAIRVLDALDDAEFAAREGA